MIRPSIVRWIHALGSSSEYSRACANKQNARCIPGLHSCRSMRADPRFRRHAAAVTAPRRSFAAALLQLRGSCVVSAPSLRCELRLACVAQLRHSSDAAASQLRCDRSCVAALT